MGALAHSVVPVSSAVALAEGAREGCSDTGESLGGDSGPELRERSSGVEREPTDSGSPEHGLLLGDSASTGGVWARR